LGLFVIFLLAVHEALVCSTNTVFAREPRATDSSLADSVSLSLNENRANLGVPWLAKPAKNNDPARGHPNFTARGPSISRIGKDQGEKARYS
jgi:hypothetical protein